MVLQTNYLSIRLLFNGNSFRCIVSGAVCTSVTSNVVTLTVNPVLGGVFAVGTGGDFETLSAAVAAYNASACFSGDCSI